MTHDNGAYVKFPPAVERAREAAGWVNPRKIARRNNLPGHKMTLVGNVGADSSSSWGYAECECGWRGPDRSFPGAATPDADGHLVPLVEALNAR